MPAPKDIVRFYEITALREKGWTYKRIADHLGMTTQNLHALKKRHIGFSRNQLVDDLLTYQTTDAQAKKLLTEAAINILRLQEALQNTNPLPTRVPVSTL